jgi:hypothetical protein
VTARDDQVARDDGLEALGPTKAPAVQDNYLVKLVKYIPAEVVAAYQAGEGIIPSLKYASVIQWIWFGILLVASPFWIGIATRERGQPIAWFQTAVAPVAFTVWVFALGGPFKDSFSWYEPGLGSLLLIAVTLLLPIVEKPLIK